MTGRRYWLGALARASARLGGHRERCRSVKARQERPDRCSDYGSPLFVEHRSRLFGLAKRTLGEPPMTPHGR